MSKIQLIDNDTLARIVRLCVTIATLFTIVHKAESKQPSASEAVDLDRILAVRILSMSERDLVRAALTPELITANFTSSFELKRTEPAWRQFRKAMESTTLTVGTERGDHRWAILFLDSNGRIIRTLAIDRLRRLANLNGQGYRIDGELLSWLKEQHKLLTPRR